MKKCLNLLVIILFVSLLVNACGCPVNKNYKGYTVSQGGNHWECIDFEILEDGIVLHGYREWTGYNNGYAYHEADLRVYGSFAITETVLSLYPAEYAKLIAYRAPYKEIDK